MCKFILGLVVGVFLIPTIKEIIYTKDFFGFKDVFKEPLELIKGILDRTFKGGY